jgi:L-alanine-DL-glutamate epimerase-like enolase superfamily enzyme
MTNPSPSAGPLTTPLLAGVARELIQITDVRITRLTYKPADGSYVHECGPVVLTKYDVAIVEVFTDQSPVGIGPGDVHGPTDYAQLIGKNPFDLLERRERRLPAGLAGLDVACWDIIGQATGKPVYQLLATDNTIANPRFPHAWARAQTREAQVWARYAS